MLTVNLTVEQFDLLSDLVGRKFDEISQAWLPDEETKDMNKLAYSTLLNLRTVQMSAMYDREIADDNNPFLISKEHFLKENCLVTDEQLVQQGIR